MQEAIYWLELLTKTNFITQQEYDSINKDATEIKKILAAIVKTTFTKSKKIGVGRNAEQKN